jgi:hypothetical protein
MPSTQLIVALYLWPNARSSRVCFPLQLAPDWRAVTNHHRAVALPQRGEDGRLQVF